MEQLIDRIEQVWPLTGVKLGGLQESSGADVYRLHTNQGPFMLKLLRASLGSEQADRYLFVLRFLENGDFPVPKVLAARDGQLSVNWEGRRIYIMEYIEGRALAENEREEHELGRMAARLHKITDYPYHTSLVSKDTLLSCLRGHKIKAEYDRLLLSLPDFSKDKQVLIHTDLCPANAIWTPQGQVVLIDLDDAGMGPRSLDLGYPLICQFIDYEGRLYRRPPEKGAKLYFKQDIAKAFYTGSFADAAPGREEKEFIFSGAVYRMLEDLAYLPPEALDFRWQHLLYALEIKERLLQVL